MTGGDLPRAGAIARLLGPGTRVRRAAARAVPFLLLAALLLPPAARALAGEVIAEIAVTGNRRTTRDFILAEAGVRVGDPWRPGIEQEVRRALLNATLFHRVEVTSRKAAGGILLSIDVGEKWTLIPFPLVHLREGEETYGLTVMESNLLGGHELLTLSVTEREGRWSEFLFYSDPHLAGTDAILLLSGRNLHRELDAWDGDEEVGAFSQTARGGSFGGGYHLLPDLSLTVSWSVARLDHERLKGAPLLPADGTESSLGIVGDWDRTDKDGADVEGFRARLQLSADVPALGSDFHRRQLEWSASWYFHPWRDHLVSLANSGALGWRLPAGRPFEASRMKSREQGRLASDRLLVTTLDYVVPFWSTRQTDLSVAAFLENALLRDAHRRFGLEDSASGGGLALRLYLRRVLLPVMQLYVAWNFETGEALPGFALGFLF